MPKAISTLSGKQYDVAVIGGGINGASAAQELSAAGYSVLLVEMGDFGSGSSSRSSRLLHCGLRYLAPGRSIMDFALHPTRLFSALRMARLGMQARSEFVRTASARTRSMQFCFPIFKNGPYRGWQIDIAFSLLKHLGPMDLPLDYRRISPAEANKIPILRNLRDVNQLESVAIYREYQFDWPERICIDAVLDAERLGADVRNYAAAKTIRREKDEWVIEVSCREGAAVVSAKAILNMAGIWIDGVNQTAVAGAQRRVLGTKGCHILIKLPSDCAGMGIATLNSAQEPLYCIPWRGYHYFGPTETIYEGEKDNISVTPQERAFLISEANRLLPTLGLSESDVYMDWAGVRPLTYDESVPFGNRSRVIHNLSTDGMPNVFAMTAGPVMTCRSGGREMLGLISRRLKPSRKARSPDYEARKFPENQNSPPLLQEDPVTKLSDLAYAAREEHAQSLSDILIRRVGVGWDCALSYDELSRAAEVVGAELGWDSERKEREIRTYNDETSLLFHPKKDLRPIGRGLSC